jgi:hypothetical protein
MFLHEIQDSSDETSDSLMEYLGEQKRVGERDEAHSNGLCAAHVSQHEGD